MIASVEDIPIPIQPASIPGQKDLLSWEPRTETEPEPEPEYFRKCNRCGEQPPVIYDPKVSPSGCPVCRYNEFSLVPAPVEEGNEHMSATATAPRKSQEDQTKALKAKGSSAALDFKTNGIDWEEIDIEVALIQPRPGQPRKYFDPDKLNELADNIELLGVLQRVLVQRIDDGYQLIAGERRWRACELRGRKLIPARVVNATEEQIELICLTENLQREGLTVIEEAEAYQRAIDNLKCTQSQLAKKLGLSQGQVSNRIRLLKNPPAIRQAIISGEIDASTGRDIATWCDVPEVYDRLQEYAAKDFLDGLDKDSLLNALASITWQSSRPLDKPYPTTLDEHRIVRLDGVLPALRKKLDIRDVSSYHGAPGQPRAMNVALWNELATVYVREATPDEDDELGNDQGGPGEDAATRKPAKAAKSAEELEKERAAAAKARQEELQFYLAGWYWRTIAAWIPDADVGIIWRLFVYFACELDTSRDRGTDEWLAEILTQCGGRAVADAESRIDLWASMATLNHPETFAYLMLSQWARNEVATFYYEDEMRELEQIAKEFGIKVADVWECDREFLELFDQDGLVNLMLEWKRRGPGNAVSEREPLIDWMLEENGRKKFPAPKCLKSLKLTDK